MNVAVFISALGHHQEIPRKFVRLLNSRPLISYSLALSKDLTAHRNIFLLTDDEELELIGKRSDVSTVLFKNPDSFPKMFGMGGTVDLLLERERKQRRLFEQVIWLGPSSPLLRSQDVKDAISYLMTMPFDAVFSTSEQPQRGWHRREDRTFLPCFLEVSNVPRTGLMHSETGAFFIMKRASINPEGYAGKLARPYLLHEARSIEIHTFNDWWVAEKMLKRKNILFVVAGYREIGMGHVYRALTLAQELHNHGVQFLCTKESALAAKHISGSFYPTHQQQPEESLLASVIRLSPDLVINDILDTDDSYIDGLTARAIKVVNFEDSGTGSYRADLCVNALYQRSMAPNMLAGYRYFELREEFAAARPGPFHRKVRNVLVTFGGTDDKNLSLHLLRSLMPLASEHGFGITLVTGPGNIHKQIIGDYLDQSRQSGDLVRWIANGTMQISAHMSRCDFAVSSAGRTVYELAAMRIPTLVIPSNERERLHTFGKNAGMLFLPMEGSFDKKLNRRLKQLVCDPALRLRIRKKLCAYDFSQGKKNIIKKITGLLESHE